MGRVHFWAFLKDKQGQPLVGGNVSLYLSGTDTDAVVFTTSVSASGGTDRRDQSSWTTGASGYFDFYIGDEWEENFGYSADQLFRLEWTDGTPSPSARGEIDQLQIFDQIFPMDQTLEDTTENKMVSNEYAYKWDNHVALTYTDEVHSIHPVDTTDASDATFDKVVTNELLNRIDNLTSTLLACGGEGIVISASGSLIDIQPVGASAWSASADGTYFADVTYRLTRDKQFPIVQIWDEDSAQIWQPKEIRDVDNDTLRIWSNDNTINMRVTVAGEVVS
jgi:hypothetical protein